MNKSIEVNPGLALPVALPTLKQRWWKLMEFRIGIVPLPVFVLLCGLIAGFVALGKLPRDITTTIALLVLGGTMCAEIGKRAPFLKLIGGAAIVSAFLPSYLVYAGLLPTAVVKSVTEFTKSTQFIYLFIATIIVGAIFKMDRRMLIKGFLKIILPLGIGSIVACAVGVTVAVAMGIPAREAFFYLIVPIMGGGVGEGVIPLSLGYSEILGNGLTHGQVFARLLPVALMANLVSIACAGFLNHFGKKFPQYSGDGRLQAGETDSELEARDGAPKHDDNFFAIDVTTIAAGGITAITLYLVGVMGNMLAGIPAPIGMLFSAILLKVFMVIPPSLEEGARCVTRFFTVGVTYPLMFAIAVSSTPWHELVAAFNLPNVLTIVATVTTLTAVGFFVARWFSLNPVESAVVNACHSGLGGTGDVAILTAADRMGLMPFAQIATRIGGALTVMIALFMLSRVGMG
jgi:CCS family citrate carrier protein